VFCSEAHFDRLECHCNSAKDQRNRNGIGLSNESLASGERVEHVRAEQKHQARERHQDRRRTAQQQENVRCGSSRDSIPMPPDVWGSPTLHPVLECAHDPLVTGRLPFPLSITTKVIRTDDTKGGTT